MTTKLFDLKGKVVLVTGSSRGIGAAAAKLLAEQGAHVIVSSRKLEGCKNVVDIIHENGGSAEAIACHIGELEDVAKIFSTIRKKFGKLDILVNNAATNPFLGHVLDIDLKAYQKTVDVNLRGYFFMSVEAGKLMRENDGGVIINVASINAVHPVEQQGIYSITKAAVVNMTKVFAKECAQYNIRCNALLPGMTKTHFTEAFFVDENIYNTAVEGIPLKRHAEPEEMAGAVLYLASNASSYTNGACLVVDGGLTI
ncbi:MAG: short-chain dehydrogenase [Alphaproteobacteria bacterium]|nr:MAG: short-chain dehydrogenase [Alphaproteobacteria bacterium]